MSCTLRIVSGAYRCQINCNKSCRDDQLSVIHFLPVAYFGLWPCCSADSSRGGEHLAKRVHQAAPINSEIRNAGWRWNRKVPKTGLRVRTCRIVLWYGKLDRTPAGKKIQDDNR